MNMESTAAQDDPIMDFLEEDTFDREQTRKFINIFSSGRTKEELAFTMSVS
jgi:hypothetical protein